MESPGTSPAEELLRTHLSLAGRLASVTKLQTPCSDYDENYSTAMAALWECAQKWQGRGAFEAFVRFCYKRRLQDRLRAANGRSCRAQERRGCNIGKVPLDEQIGGRSVSELVTTGYVAPGMRFEDLAEEIRRCAFSKKERIVIEAVLLKGETIKETARRLRLTCARVSQIRFAALRKARARLQRSVEVGILLGN